MRRILRISALVLLCIAAVALITGWGLLATEAGQRWLLTELSRRTAVSITADQVEGRLFDRLHLTGATLRWPQGEAHFDAVELRWQPAALLYGQLAIDTLAVTGGTFTLSATTEKAEKNALPLWPRVEGWPLWLSATVDRLLLEDLTLRGPTEARHLDRLVAHLSWQRGTLTVEALEAVAEGYRLHGTARAGFRRPQLQLALQLDLPAPLAAAEQLILDARLAPAKGLIMAGPFALHGFHETSSAWQVSGELTIGADTLTLLDLALTQSSRRGTIGGTASVTFTEDQPDWTARMTLTDLDLAPELGMGTALDGRLAASGQGTTCQGEFAVTNRGDGWQALDLSGPFAVDANGIALPRLTGSWLKGTLGGALRLAWGTELRLTASLAGRALDPAMIAADWSGQLNVEVDGEVRRADGEPLQAHLRGRLLDSTLRGYPLRGRVDATLSDDDLELTALELRGDGVSLHGRGRLAERLDWRAEIAALDDLLPAAHGELTAQGWLRRRAGCWTGAIDGHGRRLGYAQLTFDALRLEGQLTEDGTVAAQLNAARVSYGSWQLDKTAVHLSGRQQSHAITMTTRWAGGELILAAGGGWSERVWRGTLQRLDGKDTSAGSWRLLEPTALAIAPMQVSLAPLRLGGEGKELVRLRGDLSGTPWQGEGELHWQDLDLGRFNRGLPATLTGLSDGSVRLHLPADGGMELSGTLTGTGEVRHGDHALPIRRVDGQLLWGAAGLRATLDATLDDSARLDARLTASQSGGLTLPGQAQFAIDWSGFALEHLRPWLPAAVTLNGVCRGSTSGEWQGGEILAVNGTVTVDRGSLQWQTPDGTVMAGLRTARLDWQWEGDTLQGAANLDLADFGSLQGSFQLPLPVRFPAAVDPAGPLHVDFTGQVAERGMLAAFFPGLVDNSRGSLQLRAHARGTWQQPELSGAIRLSDAGAYFPAAGIVLRDISLDGELAGDELHIRTFRASSGPGQVNGSGALKLRGWQPVSYQGTLQGERFEAVSFPELRLLVSPDLTFSGDRNRLNLQGSLLVPELTARDRQQQGVIRESPDVVLVGVEAPIKREFPLALEVRVRLILGERVLVKVAGVDARLDGEIALQATAPDVVTARGEIQVAQGIYTSYGVQLKIERGRLIYAGGPVGQPTLDILALRRVGEIKAGAQIGGTPRSPQVKLYAEPAMPDSDILSYIVFGHPLHSSSGEFSLLSAAAGALLSRGESVMLQDQIKQQLGIDVIEVEGGDTLSGSMITVGKYLNPKLYLSFGQALFDNASETRLRYTISPRWELETKTTGEKSGGDIYYKIEFD
jgi:translocation and assembly module TamB